VPALITRPPYPGNVWRGPQRVCLALGVVFVLVAVGVVDERLHGTSTTSKVSIVPIDDRRVAPAPDLATLNLVGDELMGLVAPSQRTSPAMAYDSRSDRVILFGGATTAGNLDDTWGYDFETNTWMNMEPAVKPPGRAYHAMAYDSGSDRVILFSGSSAVGPLNDTWAYDFGANEWTNMTPASSPPVRSNHAMAYDSQSDRVILFGGGDSATGFLNDTWAYDFATDTWTNMTSAAKPSGRYYHAMAYDLRSDRVILFGGGSAGYLNDTWSYDFNTNTWTDMAPAVSPPTLYGHAMAYDSESDRVILFGGVTTMIYAIVTNDTWAYDFNTNTWTDMAPAVRPPVR